MHAPVLWQNAVVLQRLTERKEWKFFAVLPKASRGLAAAWWASLLLRGILPAVFAIAMGVLVGTVQRGNPLAGPLAFVGVIFVLLQVLGPIHQAVSANLGDRTAAWLYDRLTEACVRPPGMGHLEDPTLTSDLTVARDFDRGMTGPPLSISMDFIATGMVEMIGGVASAVILARYAWWAPTLLAGAWLATHWILSDSAIWHDRNTEEVRGAQRDADYAYRLAVDPPASTMGAHQAYRARIAADATPPIISTMPVAMKSMEIDSGGPVIPRSKSRATVRSLVSAASSRCPMPGGRTQASVSRS